jgi:hypothetical protein
MREATTQIVQFSIHSTRGITNVYQICDNFFLKKILYAFVGLLRHKQEEEYVLLLIVFLIMITLTYYLLRDNKMNTSHKKQINILYDHQIFSLQSVGGISSYVRTLIEGISVYKRI